MSDTIQRTMKNRISKKQRIDCLKDWLTSNGMPYREGSFLIESPHYMYKRLKEIEPKEL